jgi:protein SCO1
MRARARIILLSLAAVLAVAFAVAVLLERPSDHGSPASSSSGSGSATDSATSVPSASGFDGAALPANVRARGFTLTDLVPSTGPAGPTGPTGPAGRSRRQTVSLSAYRGQVVVLAFLYSTCGPTCIVIAQQIRGALDELGGRAPAVLIVSADATADTPANVRRFLARVSLSGRVHYLGGSPARLRTVWHAYGAIPASAGRAAFANSASVLLIDPHGFERVLFQAEQLTPEGLAHDIRKLQNEPMG